MDKVRKKIVEKSAKMAMLKEYESKLAAILNKIRTESLNKLSIYRDEHETIKALVEFFKRDWYSCSTHEIPADGIKTAIGDLIRGIKCILSATEERIQLEEDYPDDIAGYGLFSRHVDKSQRTDAWTDGSANCPAGEPNGEGEG